RIAEADVLGATLRNTTEGPDPVEALAVDLVELLRCARRNGRGLLEEPADPGLVGEIAHGGRPLLGHELASLVAMERVAPREHRRPGELGLRDLVVDEAARLRQAVTRMDARAAEPPLVTPEDHVRTRHVPDDRRRRAVPGVAADRERLGRHDGPEPAAPPSPFG